eukprot:352537-Chlamydomonas_euryale.AAC.3
MSANLSNQVTRRLRSPGFDRASAGRSGPVFSRPAALIPANRQASGVENLGTKQRSLDNTQRNRQGALHDRCETVRFVCKGEWQQPGPTWCSSNSNSSFTGDPQTQTQALLVS